MGRSRIDADLFLAIADPTRRQILDTLRRRGSELTMTEIAAPFDVTLSAVSQHLRVLREANIVTVRSVGRERHYELNAQPLMEVSNWVRNYEEFWDASLLRLGAALDSGDE